MKLVSYRQSGKVRLGACVDDGEFIVDLGRAHRELLSSQAGPAKGRRSTKALPAEMLSFLQAGRGATESAQQTLHFIDRQKVNGGIETLVGKRILVRSSAAALAAPVPRPPKLIAVWVNYLEHAQEARTNAPKAAPLFFTKFPTAVIGPGEPIVLPRLSQKVDYEAELALVIGKRGKYIPMEKAYEYIAGYTIMNDVSARDFSLRELLGVIGPSDVQKSFDTFAPMGPYLVTSDEVPDPHALRIQLRIGDEVLQDSNTGYMIHRIPEIIAYISAIATLEPGDVITTGTPPGVGYARTPPRFLRAGETVRVEIDKIGVLENPVVSEAR